MGLDRPTPLSGPSSGDKVRCARTKRDMRCALRGGSFEYTDFNGR
jgi:hypothetical protein